MKFSFIAISIIFLALPFHYVVAQCNGGRYYDPIFTEEKFSNIPFGKNVDYKGDTVYLSMHIFQPENDTLRHRPLIVLAFGGSFTIGFKDSPDIIRLCEEFARRGYVTATIDYRLGFPNNNDSDTNQLKALFRGIQDMKAAVRFFYKDAKTTDTYRIDTNLVFIGGVSAGFFIGLNYAYFKETGTTRPVPQWAVDAYNEIGGLEGVSGNQGYGSKVVGVINLCGGLGDTSWIKADDPILVSMHGSEDNLVPFGTDTGSGSVEALFHGSSTIHKKADLAGLHNAFYPFWGASHVPFVQPVPFLPPATLYMDTTIQFLRDFLHDAICNLKIGVNEKEVEPGNISIYPNPASSAILFDIKEAYNFPVLIELIDALGRPMVTEKLYKGVKRYNMDIPELNNGLYFLVVRNGQTGEALKSQVQVIRKD